MVARWATFAVGLWLLLAPLVLGYGAVGPILQDVAMGLLVCVGTLAALDWPPFRFALLVPAAWLVRPGRGGGDPDAAIAELVSGVLLAVLTLVPSPRLLRASRGPRDEDGGREAGASPGPRDRAGVRV
jgi:hypothetical protein